MKKRHGLYAAILVCICLAALAAFRWSSVSASSEIVSDYERANVPQGLWIWIDIHQKTLTLYEGTQVKKTYTIATGAWGTPTPIGTFRINSRFAGELGGFGT